MQVATKEFLYAVGIGTVSLIAVAIGYIVSIVLNQRRYIASQRQSHEELRQLSARIQTVREEERVKIAREIHDELGQLLTVAKMYLTVLPKRRDGKATDGEVKKRVGSVVKMIDDSISLVKSIAYELRPIVLDDMGVKEAIEWEAKKIGKRTGIECTVKSEGGSIDLARERSVALFRVFQEAMTNVIRHSGASHVSITLRSERDTVSLEIIDNGKGIDEQSMQKKNSLGIVGMRERALFLGGHLTVSTRNGSGTVVSLDIPRMKGEIDGR